MNTTGYAYTQSQTPYAGGLMGDANIPKVTTGIQYELDAIQNVVASLRDAVLSLESRLAPVSFPTPPTAGTGTTSPNVMRPSASNVTDAMFRIRMELGDITDLVHHTRGNLDL